MKEYILPGNAHQLLEEGKVYTLGYDDFNKGVFSYNHS